MTDVDWLERESAKSGNTNLACADFGIADFINKLH